VVRAGGRGVLLIHSLDRIWAVQTNCPHMAFPLEFAKVGSDYSIICALHHSAFDLRTGDVKDWSPWPPGIGPLFKNVSRRKALRIYPTKVEAGHIWVDA
jgi:nitrite reductase/ring-hydroxylating ferredoxin subunit